MTNDPIVPQSDRPQTPPRSLARRGFVLGGVAVVALGGAAYGRWFNLTGRLGKGALKVQEAHALALSGDILLIDIRRPDEWARSGVPEGGVALDMRRKDFVEALLSQTDGAKNHPIAVICARGVRSRALRNRLEKAGFTHVLDVPEGMLGSGAGPGWLKSGLPVVAP